MQDRMTLLSSRLIGFSRTKRILLSIFFTLMVTLALSPLIDEIYLGYFYTDETVILPAMITAGFGCAMYIVGWRIYVGTVNIVPEARRAVVWYFAVGIVATLIVIILLANGVAILNLVE